MVKKNLDVIFSDEDKAGLVVRKYIDTEGKEEIKQYKKRSWTRRIIQLIIMLVLAVPAVASEDFTISYFSIIGIITVAFIFLLTEIMSLKKRKLVYSLFYVEVVVNKILDTEIVTYSTDGSTMRFYPIEGTDTSSGYSSIFYVQKDEYDKAKCGEKLRIKVKGEKL